MCMLWCPRKSGGSKFDPCEYCGSLPTVSLSFDSFFLNSDLKAKTEKKISILNQRSLKMMRKQLHRLQ